MLRVGLILPLRGMWRGGLNYYHNLLSCYRNYPDPDIRLELFVDTPEDVSQYACDAIAVRATPEVKNLSLRRPSDWPRRFINQVRGFDPTLLRIVEQSGVDMLTHNTVGRQTAVDTLPWLPDLQHKFYPEMFPRREHYKRDTEIANTALWGHILLSSQTAATHFRQFYPELAAVETYVLRFPNTASLDVKLTSRDELATSYPVSDPYLFLPNQFWKHKNHSVVIKALSLTPAHVRVICTGPMDEPRDASYIPGLMAAVKDAGLQDRFICLGVVSYGTMISLMHHAVAVLQPSLFEGWSTSVEESKAMAKKIIVSNIDVHLEQAPERGIYFSPDSPQELAAAMTQAMAEFSSEQEESYASHRAQFKATIEREWIGHFADILKGSHSRWPPHRG